MSLKISQREKEGVVILDMDGRLVAGDETTVLRDTITALQAAGSNKMVLNLQEVSYIDSTGLGTMVLCWTRSNRANGNLKLVNLTRRSIELLVVTKLTTIFEVFDDEQSAVNSFFPDREIKHFDILSFVQEQEKKK